MKLSSPTLLSAASTPAKKALSAASSSSSIDSSNGSVCSDEETFKCIKLPFHIKLRRMLEFASERDLEDVVSWEMDGCAMKVHDSRRFEQYLLPLFFTQTRVKSFQRKLNAHGFYRITGGTYKGCYMHKLFKRDDETPKKTSTSSSGSNKDGASIDSTTKAFKATPTVVSDTSSITTLAASSLPSSTRKLVQSTTQYEGENHDWMVIPSTVTIGVDPSAATAKFVFDNRDFDDDPFERMIDSVLF